jgi:transposase
LATTIRNRRDEWITLGVFARLIRCRKTSRFTWTPAMTPAKSRDTLAGRGLHGQIVHKGEKAPIQASGRWHVERTNAWHIVCNRLQRCYERRGVVIDAFFDLTDVIITVRAHPASVDYPPLGR